MLQVQSMQQHTQPKMMMLVTHTLNRCIIPGLKSQNSYAVPAGVVGVSSQIMTFSSVWPYIFEMVEEQPGKQG